MPHASQKGPFQATPMQRDKMLFNWADDLIPSMPPRGRYPVTDDCTLFEIWMSLVAPCDQTLRLTVYRYVPQSPDIPLVIATADLAAGRYIGVKDSDLMLDVDRGDQMAVGLDALGTPTTGAGFVSELRFS